MTQNTKESVWAISKANVPFYRDGITQGKEEGTRWDQVDGLCDHISVSISGTVWAIMHDKIFVRSEVTPNNEMGTAWTPVDHDFSVIKLEAGGNCLWAYGRDNLLYVRTGMGFHSSNPNRIGTGWKILTTPTTPAGVTDMALTAQDDFFVLTDDGKLFKRDGCTQHCPEGVSWAKVSLPKTGGGGFLGLGAAPSVIQIAGGLEHLWAVTDSHEVWRASYAGIITEHSWERIPGQKMVYVCPSMCDKEITWGINNRDQMFVRSSPKVGRYEWLRQGTILFGSVSVGVMLNYTLPNEKPRHKLARMLSAPKIEQPTSERLQITDLPFKLDEHESMSEDLLNALVIPILSKSEILQRYNYDFTTEETVMREAALESRP